MALYDARVEYALHPLLDRSLAPEGMAQSRYDLADLQRLPLFQGSERVRGSWLPARLPWPDDTPPKPAASHVCETHGVKLSAEAALRREPGGQSLDIGARMRTKRSPVRASAIPDLFLNCYAGRRAPARETGE